MLEGHPFWRTHGKEDRKSETCTLDENNACGLAETLEGENAGREDFETDEAHRGSTAAASLFAWDKPWTSSIGHVLDKRSKSNVGYGRDRRVRPVGVSTVVPAAPSRCLRSCVGAEGGESRILSRAKACFDDTQ